MEISDKLAATNYLAGIVDGEGTIQVDVPRPSKRNYFAAVYITNTNKELLEMLKKEFGGFIQGPYKNGLRSKLIYRLVWHGKATRPLLEALLSSKWFFVKRRQAELALEFERLREQNYRNNLSKRGYGDELRATFIRIRDEIKHLNKRGAIAVSETKPESGLDFAPPTIDSPLPV